eukprot:895592_1
MHSICFILSLLFVIQLNIKLFKSIEIFYDSMDNAVATGWSFSNDRYNSPTNDEDCPNGGYCTEIWDATMTRTFTNIDSYISFQIQYDMSYHLNGGVIVRYKYNNHANYVYFMKEFALISQSRLTATYLNTLAAPVGATSVTFWFYRTSNFQTEYNIYLDNFYFIGTTAAPSNNPTKAPTPAPTLSPTTAPTKAPTIAPTNAPTNYPSNSPSFFPSLHPSSSPTLPPTTTPSTSPTKSPSGSPSFPPSRAPTSNPTSAPSRNPTVTTQYPSAAPSIPPTTSPSVIPSFAPSNHPSNSPSNSPSFPPTNYPSNSPSSAPTVSPTFIDGFEYGVCSDLSNHIDVLYDISHFQCINYCKLTNDCRMINHYKYFKTEDDTRCYIFG